MSEYFRKPIVKTLMLKGQEGQSIKEIKKTSTSGLADTYTITLTDGATSTFSVTNGKGISSISKTGTSGLVDTYTIKFNDGTTSTFTVTNGEGLQKLQVGGRNYLLGSDIKLTGDGEKTGTRIDANFINQNLGKQITLSIRYTAENWKGNRFGFEVPVTYDDGTTEYYGVWINTGANGNATLSKTILLPTEHGKGTIELNSTALFVQGTSSGTVTLYKPKLELGNIATDWTPAFEDIIDTSITNSDIDTILNS